MKSKITVFILLALLADISGYSQKKPWPVPDASKTKKNPVASTAESIAAGKALWTTHCKSCHGTKGLGDGPKASQLNTEPGDFSAAGFQSQTDGSLFYKTSEGRDDMPAFKKKISAPEDIWRLVVYMRTLGKGGAVVVTPPKDTAVKKVTNPVTTEKPPVKKDTVVKVDKPVAPKTETPSLQEQINRLAARMDSLGREFQSLKEKMEKDKRADSLHHQ